MVMLAQVQTVVVVVIAAMGAILVMILYLPIPTGHRRAKDRGGNILGIGDPDWSNMSIGRSDTTNTMVMKEVLV